MAIPATSKEFARCPLDDLATFYKPFNHDLLHLVELVHGPEFRDRYWTHWDAEGG
jgi:hypothetical protein